MTFDDLLGVLRGTMKGIESLLEDLEDLVGQLQSDKISEKQTIEILSNIVEFEKGKVSNEK